MSEEQTEAAAIDAIKGLIPESSYNIGQAEEPEAKPEVAAEPKQETKIETTEIVPEPVKAESQGDEEAEIDYEGDRYKVPAKLKDAFLRQQDYTKKTMELADQRKAVEALKGQIDPNIAQKLTHYEQLLGSAVQSDQQVDWVKLLREDPIGYLERKELAEARAREWQQVEVKNQQEYATKVSQAGTKEWEQLIAKRPDLKEAAAFKAHDQKVRTFLAEQGYQAKEIDPAVFDHRVRLMVEDAIKYRDLQIAKTETAKKIEKLPPKVERPGVPSGSDSQGAKSAMGRLKASGKVDDAADALRALMG